MRIQDSGFRIQPGIRFAGFLLSAFCLLPSVLHAQTGPAKTTVADTLYAPDGSLVSGKLTIIANSTFTSADGYVVPAGTKREVTLISGAFSVALVPNAGSNPAGTSYSVKYFMVGAAITETWIVPSSGTAVNLLAVRALSAPLPTIMLAFAQLNPPASCTNKFPKWTGTSWTCDVGGGASTFDAIGSGTNITAAMVVGSGASLSFMGTGNLNARKIQGVEVTGTPAVGQIPIASSGTAAAWGDPLVSGFTAHDAPGATTNPVAMGGFASAAAPLDVSADTDIVRMWSLRNGSPVINLATAGTLYDARQIRALTSSDVVSAAQSGTWTIQPGNTANTTAWLVTGSGGTFPVTGTFWQATQPVSGTVTANAGTGNFGVNLTQLGGTALSAANVVDAGNTAFRVNCVTGCVAGGSFTDNTAFTGGATAVTNVGALYDTTPPAITDGNAGIPRMNSTRVLLTDLFQVGGTAITLGQKAMSASIPFVLASDQFLDTTATGGIAALDAEVCVSPVGEATAGIQVTGSWVATLSFRATVDNTNYFLTNAYPVGNGAPVTSSTANGNWQIPDAGFKKICVRATAYTSGTATVTIISSAGPNVQIVGVREALPAGTNNIGDVDVLTFPDNEPFNFAQYGGVAVGAGNAVHVQPGTSAVFQVQSNSANLATQVEIDKLTLAQGSTTTGQEGTLVQGAVTTAAPTYTTGQTSPLSLTTAGGVRVDGSSVTQPVSGTVNIGVFPDNEPINVAQYGGVAVLAGNGVTGTGSPRVTIASDNSAVSGMGVGATGAAPPANANLTGGLASGATGGFLTGISVGDSFVNVNVSTATTTLLVTGVSGRHVRITSMNLVTAAANNVALISGTGATCGTGTTGMSGGTTAATGWNFAAGGGLAQGGGLGTINQTNATGDSVCIVTSAATQLSGRIGYAIY